MAMTATYEDRVGEVVQSRYRIIALLGAGGFGAVYRARHLQMDTDVALKILHAEHCRDPRAVKRFELEAKRSAMLKHANTIRVFDYGPTERGEFFIAMELLEGRSLAAVLRREGVIAPGRALHILSQVLRSLDEAHLAGLVHRDLKPDNIYLVTVGRERDFVKVLDFGIAKAARQDAGMTTVGTIIGTPTYMSPEQCRGLDLDGRSDLYALGCIAFEMLCGRTPFVAKDTLGYLLAHTQDAPPDPRDLAGPERPIPVGLVAWIGRLLRKDPAARYPDAMSALDALATALAGEPTWEFDNPSAGRQARHEPDGLGAPTPMGTRRAPAQAAPRPTAKRWWLALGAAALAGGAATLVVATSAGDPVADSIAPIAADAHAAADASVVAAQDVPAEVARHAVAVEPTADTVAVAAERAADTVAAEREADAAVVAAELAASPAVADVAAARDEAAPARLVVKSAPPGARVVIDGRDAGRAPLDFETRVGARHKVVLSARGRITTTREVVVADDVVTLEVTLELKPDPGSGLLDF